MQPGILLEEEMTPYRQKKTCEHWKPIPLSFGEYHCTHPHTNSTEALKRGCCDIEIIKPQPECFGKWQGLDSKKCNVCHIWGYCGDVTTRTTAIRNATLDDALKYIHPDSPSGKVLESLRTPTTNQQEREE